MTITQTTAHHGTSNTFRLVSLDLYRDVHKGIRAELFSLTAAAGRLDPADHSGRVDLARYVGSVVDLLVTHAEHEDTHVQPAIEAHLPALGAQVESDHAALEVWLVDLRAAADAIVDADAPTWRSGLHALYGELAAFTSAYLAHQDVEERVIMPALESAMGFEAVLAIHTAIISSIPPAEMARSLAIMIPAMNLDDRAELLGGMRAGAPAEAFAGIWGLVGSVLSPTDHAALAGRLGIAR